MLILESANVTRGVELWTDLGWEPHGSGGGAVPRNRGMFSEEGAGSEDQAINSHCGKVHCPFLLQN